MPVFEFLAVIGTTIAGNASDADVFFPASTFAETNGTFFSSPGKVLQVKKAIHSKTVMENWQLIQKFAESAGDNSFNFNSVELINNELLKL